MKTVCIFGASREEIRKEYKQAAFDLGKYLAENGFAVIFGGGATGLMGKAAEGFREGDPNGKLIGIAPRFFDQPGILYQNCSEMLWTETMSERKQLMEEKADLFIVLPGGIGTFEEFFEVFTLRQLERHQKQIILYNAAGYYDLMKELIDHTVSEGMMNRVEADHCAIVSSLAELQEILKSSK